MIVSIFMSFLAIIGEELMKWNRCPSFASVSVKKNITKIRNYSLTSVYEEEKNFDFKYTTLIRISPKKKVLYPYLHGFEKVITFGEAIQLRFKLQI